MRKILFFILVISFAAANVFSQTQVKERHVVILKSMGSHYQSKDNGRTWLNTDNEARTIIARWADGNQEYSNDRGITWRAYNAKLSKNDPSYNDLTTAYSNNTLTIEFGSNVEATARLCIINLLGNSLVNEQINVSKGLNKRIVPSVDLSTGTYFVAIIFGTNNKLEGNFIVY